ncbi:MAG: hypothetical protein R2941_07410 [Desulfobacterales bacterium]
MAAQDRLENPQELIFYRKKNLKTKRNPGRDDIVKRSGPSSKFAPAEPEAGVQKLSGAVIFYNKADTEQEQIFCQNILKNKSEFFSNDKRIILIFNNIAICHVIQLMRKLCHIAKTGTGSVEWEISSDTEILSKKIKILSADDP